MDQHRVKPVVRTLSSEFPGVVLLRRGAPLQLARYAGRLPRASRGAPVDRKLGGALAFPWEVHVIVAVGTLSESLSDGEKNGRDANPEILVPS